MVNTALYLHQFSNLSKYEFFVVTDFTFCFVLHTVICSTHFIWRKRAKKSW